MQINSLPFAFLRKSRFELHVDLCLVHLLLCEFIFEYGIVLDLEKYYLFAFVGA